jgi:hypothetical protein
LEISNFEGTPFIYLELIFLTTFSLIVLYVIIIILVTIFRTRKFCHVKNLNNLESASGVNNELKSKIKHFSHNCIETISSIKTNKFLSIYINKSKVLPKKFYASYLKKPISSFLRKIKFYTKNKIEK